MTDRPVRRGLQPIRAVCPGGGENLSGSLEVASLAQLRTEITAPGNSDGFVREVASHLKFKSGHV